MILLVSVSNYFNCRHMTPCGYFQKKYLHCSRPHNQLHASWHCIVWMVDCTHLPNMNAIPVLRQCFWSHWFIKLMFISIPFSIHSAVQSSSVYYVSFCYASLHPKLSNHGFYQGAFGKTISLAIRHLWSFSFPFFVSINSQARLFNVGWRW